jgi:heme/copper-type cytochrome/quinol oxidase subunit 2
MMDSLSVYMLVVGAIFLPVMAFGAYMAHRQRLEEEAEEADRANRTAAE